MKCVRKRHMCMYELTITMLHLAACVAQLLKDGRNDLMTLASGVRILLWDMGASISYDTV